MKQATRSNLGHFPGQDPASMLNGQTGAQAGSWPADFRRGPGRTGALLAAAALLTMSLAAQAADKIQLQLNWFHLADHSPIYLAMKKGYYQEEGLDLTVLRGSGSADSAKKIDLGQSDVGISDAPTVLTAISKGANLKMVAVVYDKAGNNIFFRKSADIKTPKDLAGKKIAVPPADSHRVLWPAFAAMNGVDPQSVTLVNVKPEGKQAIVAGNDVDGAFDLYTSFAIWEKVLGKGEVGHLLWADFGLPIYGHTYFVNGETARKNPKLIERFLRATHKGWRDAKADPAASIDAMVEQVPGLDRTTLLATMPQILDLCVTERSAKHGLGWIEPELMQKTIDITFANNKPDKALVLNEVFTNEFSSKIKP